MIAHMTQPMRKSSTRQVAGRRNNGTRNDAPKAKPKNQSAEAAIAPPANQTRAAGGYCADNPPIRTTVSK